MLKNQKILLVGLAIALVWNVSCGEVGGDSGSEGNDISNYKTVVIGSQTWMAENLNYNASGSKCYDNKPEIWKVIQLGNSYGTSC